MQSPKSKNQNESREIDEDPAPSPACMQSKVLMKVLIPSKCTVMVQNGDLSSSSWTPNSAITPCDEVESPAGKNYSQQGNSLNKVIK